MKCYVHVSSFGKLPFWVMNSHGTVIATFTSQKRAERLVNAMNANSDWYKNTNVDL